MNKTYTLTVFNTLTLQYEDVEVTKEIYDEYRRGEWRIDKSDDRYKANETPFSALIGGEDGAYENFSEFVDDSQNPEMLLAEQGQIEALYAAINELSEADRELIQAMFCDGLTEREYAELKGVTQPTIHWKKVRILKILKNFLM